VDSYTGADLGYNNTAILGTFLFTDFEPPKIRFTGFFADRTADLDSNGVNDTLIITAELEANEVGYFRLQGTLRNTITQEDTWVTTDTQYVASNGTITIDLNFPGGWIWAQRTNTSYLVQHIRIYEVTIDGNYIYDWDSRDNTFVTNVYNSDDFDSPPAFLTGIVLETPYDYDSDGYFDFLKISVEIEATQSLTVELSGDLFGVSENVWAYNWTTLLIGTNWIDLMFPSINLYESGISQTYNLNINLHRTDDWQLLDRIRDHPTNQYSWTIWDSPSIALTGRIFDQGLDSDSDGKFDYVEILVEVDITEIANYRVESWLYSTGGMGDSFWMNWYSESPMSIGLYNISFQIDYHWFLQHPDGSSFYIDTQYLYKEYPGLNQIRQLYEDSDQFLMNSYTHADFEELEATLIGIIADFGVDFDNDSLFDTWTVIFSLNVTQPVIDIYFYAELQEIDTGNWLTSESVYIYDLPFGIHNITLDFAGNELQSSGFTDGAKVGYYRTELMDTWITIEQKHNLNWGLSNLYSWSDFSSTPPYYLEVALVKPIFGIFLPGDTLDLEIDITKVNEDVSSVNVEFYVDGVWKDSRGLNRDYYDQSLETWSTMINLDQIGTWEFMFQIWGTEGTYLTHSVTYGVYGAPIYDQFYANTTFLSPGGSVLFTAEVWDNTGISSVTLHALGNEYPMTYVGNSTVGFFAYTAVVTFNDIGDFVVYAEATDNDITPHSSDSDTITIYVNTPGAAEIVSVTASHETIEEGDSITVTVVVRKSDALITSVDLDDPLDDTIYPLSKVSETDIEETWTVTFTPEKPGNHECKVQVMNTRNEVSQASVSFRVNASEVANITPGFEILVLLVSFSGLPIARKLRNK
jgi:hypothetical protein